MKTMGGKNLEKVNGIRASANRMCGNNPEAYSNYIRDAAGMYESIGAFELAALCYCDLGDYERAGNIYLKKCKKNDEAAECYSEAAEAYLKQDEFSKCLSVCLKGKLFDKGLQYTENWKEQHVNVQAKELKSIIYRFLKKCAFYYHHQNDPESMMKFVRRFPTVGFQRVFLRGMDYIDGPFYLEQELDRSFEVADLVTSRGEDADLLDKAECFSSRKSKPVLLACRADLSLSEAESCDSSSEAAAVAKSRGDVLKEADLLEKAGRFKDSADLLLWYMFLRSLWGNGNSGWPLKQFPRKEELCQKTRYLAKLHSENFYGHVCTEIEVLSDQFSHLNKMQKQMQDSKRNNSLRGEILSIRKILDFHLCLNPSEYDWADDFPADLSKHCEDKISWNQVSIRTLVFYWNMWKENVMRIFESLDRLEDEEYTEYSDFSLNYFGVRKLDVKWKLFYLLLDKDAEWVEKFVQKVGQSDGKLPTMDIRLVAFAIRSYWQSELLSTGIKVLGTLEPLLKSKSNGSAFHKCTCLLNIFEVSKFLLDCQYLDLTLQHKNTLQQFSSIYKTYFDYVFPVDWQSSVSHDLVSLIWTDASVKLLYEILCQTVDIKGALTYLEIGRVMMLLYILPVKSGIPCDMISMKLEWNARWSSAYLKYVYWRGLKSVYAAEALQSALADTWKAKSKNDQMLSGCISPHNFLHLLDRLLFMHSCCSGIFFTTRSSFVGSFSHLQSIATPSKLPGTEMCTETWKEFRIFFIDMAKEILCNKERTKSWILNSNINIFDYHYLLELKIVMMLCLIYLKDRCSIQLLFVRHILSLLPVEFVENPRKETGQGLDLDPQVVAKAFRSIGDPLLIVSSEDVNPKNDAPPPCAIYVDCRKSKEEIMSLLFPREAVLHVHNSSHGDGSEIIPGMSSSNTLHDSNIKGNSKKGRKNRRYIVKVKKKIVKVKNIRK